MQRHRYLGSILIIAALLLSACGGGAPAASPTTAPAAEAPTTAAAAQPTSAPPTTAAAPTPTFEKVSDTEPTVGAVQATGALAWRDQILRNDAVVITINGLPPPRADE